MAYYHIGYEIERKARKQLKEKGAKIVIRSSRSLTPIDLIAIFPEKHEIWLVQCKAKIEAPKKMETILKAFQDLARLAGTYTVKPHLYMKKQGKYQFIEVKPQ